MPLQVKFWFFYDKEFPTQVPNPVSDLFQFGGAASPMQNDLVDLWAPINTDKYRVLKSRIFKLGNAEFATTGSAPTFGNFTNNDFKFNHSFSFDLTKYVPKVQVFRDNNSAPTSRGLYFMATCVSSSGSLLAGGVVPCQISYVLNYEFTDM